MIRLGTRLRDAVSATRRAEEAERQRDDARGRSQALLVEAQTLDIGLRRVLRTAGYSHLADRAHDDLPQAVDEAIAAERQRLDRAQAERDHAREAADAWRPGSVPARAARLIEEERWVHAVAAHDRGHVMFSGRARGYTDRPTFVIELADGSRRSWVADLVVEAHDQQPPPDLEETRDDTVRRLAREIIAARAVLAPDVSTAGTPLDEVARAALASARATAVAAELRWWIAPGNAPGQDYLGRLLLERRAEQLDPSGVAPDGPEPPTPTIFRADDEPRVPRRAAAGLAANLAAAARRTAQQCDAKAGHPVEVLAALRVADQAAVNLVGCQVTQGEDALQVLARAVRAYGEEPDDSPDAETEQLAREAMHAAITAPPLGWAPSAAADVVDRLARAGFVPGVYPPGMAIDGDMLRSLITDALPRWATDEFAGELADSVLDAAVRAGFTILHGPTLTPRPPAESEQHWAEQAIERAREYLTSLGYRRVVDDHGEDLVSMLREIGVAADANSTRLALIDEHLVAVGIRPHSDEAIVDGVGQLVRRYLELRQHAPEEAGR